MDAFEYESRKISFFALFIISDNTLTLVSEGIEFPGRNGR
jgi:hypothetical protein